MNNISKNSIQIPIMVIFTLPNMANCRTSYIRTILLTDCDWDDLFETIFKTVKSTAYPKGTTAEDIHIDSINEISMDFYNMLTKKQQ